VEQVNPLSLVAPLLALQFVVFGWRIVREVALQDQGRRTWLLASDLVNLVSMLAVVSLCVVLPLCRSEFPTLSRATLGAGYVLIAFTPLVVAGHYRLFSREGRSIYEQSGRDYPWLTRQEAVLLALALVFAVLATYVISAV
jgi:hypothetical protein